MKINNLIQDTTNSLRNLKMNLIARKTKDGHEYLRIIFFNTQFLWINKPPIKKTKNELLVLGKLNKGDNHGIQM